MHIEHPPLATPPLSDEKDKLRSVATQLPREGRERKREREGGTFCSFWRRHKSRQIESNSNGGSSFFIARNDSRTDIVRGGGFPVIAELSPVPRCEDPDCSAKNNLFRPSPNM